MEVRLLITDEEKKQQDADVLKEVQNAILNGSYIIALASPQGSHINYHLATRELGGKIHEIRKNIDEHFYFQELAHHKHLNTNIIPANMHNGVGQDQENFS
jgi:ADP-dependent phosphofructokinase/glucokinase